MVAAVGREVPGAPGALERIRDVLLEAARWGISPATLVLCFICRSFDAEGLVCRLACGLLPEALKRRLGVKD